MANINTNIVGDANFLNLKEIDLHSIRKEVIDMLVEGEDIIQAFSTIRDQVIFTNKRILVVNVQGITGKRTSYFSYPYSKIQYYGIETAGVLDLDSEFRVYFSNGVNLQFDFKSRLDIRHICACISEYILK